MNASDVPSIYLGSVETDDAQALHAWRSDRTIQDGALGYPFPTSLEAERDWIKGFYPKGTPNDLCLAIRETKSDLLLGYCQLRSIDWVAGVAEFGLIIGEPNARGRGIGKAALGKCLTYATSVLGLRRIWLRVVEYNKPAIHLYESAGFRREGCLLRHAFRNGRLHDVLILGWESPTSDRVAMPPVCGDAHA